MRNYLLFLLSVLCISTQAQISVKHNNMTQIDTEKKRLEKLSIEWMDAWKNKDSAKLEQLLAPDYRLVFSAPTIHIASRSEWLHVALHDYDCYSFQYTNFDIRIYGSTAIVQSTYEQNAIMHGTDRSGKFLLTDVWVKNNKNWQVVHRHSSFQPNK